MPEAAQENQPTYSQAGHQPLQLTDFTHRFEYIPYFGSNIKRGWQVNANATRGFFHLTRLEPC